MRKALELGLPAIIVVNKIDRQDQRAEEVVDEIYDLFIDLGAEDEQIDFPILFAIAKDGIAKKSMEEESTNLKPIFDQIIETTPAPKPLLEDSLQVLITRRAISPLFAIRIFLIFIFNPVRFSFV